MKRERQVCEIWSRVCGYLRPTNAWNPGKISELKKRVNFSEYNNKKIYDSKR